MIKLKYLANRMSYYSQVWIFKEKYCEYFINWAFIHLAELSSFECEKRPKSNPQFPEAKKVKCFSVCLFVYLFVCPLAYFSACLCVCMFVCPLSIVYFLLALCLFGCLSICILTVVCVFASPFVSLFVCCFRPSLYALRFFVPISQKQNVSINLGDCARPF